MPEIHGPINKTIKVPLEFIVEDAMGRVIKSQILMLSGRGMEIQHGINRHRLRFNGVPAAIKMKLDIL